MFYRQYWHAGVNLGYVAIFRKISSHYGSCMPSSPKPLITVKVHIILQKQDVIGGFIGGFMCHCCYCCCYCCCCCVMVEVGGGGGGEVVVV